MSNPAGRTGPGGWLQAIANVAILAGLILVGLQIRQATAIAEAQFLSELMDSSARGFEIIAGESLPGAWSRAMRNARSLSDEDLAVIDAFLTREWLNGIRFAALSERGRTGAPVSAELSLTAGLPWSDPDPPESTCCLLPAQRVWPCGPRKRITRLLP